MNRAVKKFLRNDKGTTAIEYGLIAALVSIGALIGLNAFASANKRVHDHVGNSMENALQNAGG